MKKLMVRLRPKIDKELLIVSTKDRNILRFFYCLQRQVVSVST